VRDWAVKTTHTYAASNQKHTQQHLKHLSNLHQQQLQQTHSDQIAVARFVFLSSHSTSSDMAINGKMNRYDVVNSPYIELHTPFTAWCVRLLWRDSSARQRTLLAPTTSATQPHNPLLCAPLCREAVKMVLLLPTVPVRLCMIVVSIILVAIVDSFAIFGWCVSLSEAALSSLRLVGPSRDSLSSSRAINQQHHTSPN
jgi:hypothetical protein